MIFAFDEQFTMFDITPVENQFILEYLPKAKGDYIKVYLYGLLNCYHPRKEMDLACMSRELDLSEEIIMEAYRYWERRGIVRRISDKPPAWLYHNIKQKNLTTEDFPIDPEYAAFSRELERAFEGERVFHGSEVALCYEWKEQMQLPTEVILMLLKHMAKVRGKNFKVGDAEKAAVRLATENAFTPDEAAEVLSRDQDMIAGMKKILRKLGKNYTPSVPQVNLYQKWRTEWGFSHEAIEEACNQTDKSDPSLALVDSILKSTYEKKGKTGKPLAAEDIERSARKRDALRKTLKEAGLPGPASAYHRELYEQMTAIYPENIVLLAARECAKKQKDFDSVLKLLQSWKERGFTDEKQIKEHVQQFHDRETFMKELRGKWSGRGADVGEKSLQLLEKWERDLGFSREMIRKAADSAFEVRRPMAYMDKILTYWAEKGIRTPEGADNDRRENREHYREFTQKPSAKTVIAQQYSQRDYSDEDAAAMRRMMELPDTEDD